MYYLIENNGPNVLPEFKIRHIFLTFDEAQEKLNNLNEVSDKNGWNNIYFITVNIGA